MLCSRIQAMVEPFINDELSVKEKNEFISHIRECKSCHEELEVYHVIYSVIDQLDRDSDQGYGYLEELEQKLNRSAEALKREKTLRICLRVALGVIIVLIACAVL